MYFCVMACIVLIIFNLAELYWKRGDLGVLPLKNFENSVQILAILDTSNEFIGLLAYRGLEN